MAITKTDFVLLCADCSLPVEDCKCAEKKTIPGEPFFTLNEGWVSDGKRAR